MNQAARFGRSRCAWVDFESGEFCNLARMGCAPARRLACFLSKISEDHPSPFLSLSTRLGPEAQTKPDCFLPFLSAPDMCL